MTKIQFCLPHTLKLPHTVKTVASIQPQDIVPKDLDLKLHVNTKLQRTQIT